MSLSGTVYPCVRCLRTVTSVIDETRYDKDETPGHVGIRAARSDSDVREIVCAKCLRSDYAAKVSPAKKIINSPAKNLMRAALRNDAEDEDEDDDAADDAHDAKDDAPIKPLPRPSGLILSSDDDDDAPKKKKLKKKLKKIGEKTSKVEDEAEQPKKKFKKKVKQPEEDEDV